MKELIPTKVRFGRLLPTLRMFSRQRAVFIIIPVAWVWLQLGAVLFFLGGAILAGFWLVGSELDKRARTAIDDYFQTQQGLMTKAQLEAKLARIEKADETLSGPGPLGQLRAVQDEVLRTMARDNAQDQALDELGQAGTGGVWNILFNFSKLTEAGKPEEVAKWKTYAAWTDKIGIDARARLKEFGDVTASPSNESLKSQ